MAKKEEEKLVRLRKIPLQVLIDSLIELYNSGANYVDIIANLNTEQDNIGLFVSEEYMKPIKGVEDVAYTKNEEESGEEDDGDDEEGEGEKYKLATPSVTKLSDEDLNRIM